ncbi:MULTISPECIES: hypothetical protein [Streptomyces]|uniref:hypothetical protein n=1 Tax=Streptomyces TaxID=1883 RepID=UPI001B34485A|nr:hypothetical protein [Streptomyces sp. AgN23]QTI88072.1 hypothetical protein AS97_45305 [Streptomyces sp. AgN23]
MECVGCAATELTAQVLQYHSVLALGGAEALMARNHWSHASAAQALDRAAHPALGVLLTMGDVERDVPVPLTLLRPSISLGGAGRS